MQQRGNEPLDRAGVRVSFDRAVSTMTLASAHARIESLRKLGFRLAIDDLGAGYAGLNSWASATRCASCAAR
jgi:EAL domain-containing protein (putative c-di-GMP-specific phosphodiesterase class I)